MRIIHTLHIHVLPEPGRSSDRDTRGVEITLTLTLPLLSLWFCVCLLRCAACHAQGSVCASCQTQHSTNNRERDSPAVWDEEVEVQDKEGQETVEIALLLEMAPT